jgi:PIN domain nuclease of toxin-antitoxin system
LRYLLDTHVFLWWVADDKRLSGPARDILGSTENELVFSVASSWEMAIKSRLGRLTVKDGLESFLTKHIELNAMTILPVDLRHTFQLNNLPLHHRDPFDRILIAQALASDLTLVTGDRLIRQYDVPVVW